MNKTFRSILNVYFSMMRRDWITLKRYKLQLIVMLISPIFYILPIYFMAKSFLDSSGQIPGFLANTGITDFVTFTIVNSIVTQYIFMALFRIAFSIYGEIFSGTLEATWIAPISRLSFLLSRSLFGLFTAIIFSFINIVAYTFFFKINFTGSIPMTLLILMITIFTLYGFSFTLAAMLIFFKEVGGLIEVIGLILPILCGSLFPISILPDKIQAIAKCIPLTYYFDMIRYYALNTKTILDPSNQLILLGVFSIIIPIIGFNIFLFAERTARKRGNFGTY